MSQQENQTKSADEIIDELINNIQSQIDILQNDLIQLQKVKYDSRKEFKEWFFGGGSGSPRGFAFGGGGEMPRGFAGGSGGSSMRGFTFGGGGAGARGFYGFLDGGFSVGNNVANDGDRVGNG